MYDSQRPTHGTFLWFPPISAQPRSLSDLYQEQSARPGWSGVALSTDADNNQQPMDIDRFPSGVDLHSSLSSSNISSDSGIGPSKITPPQPKRGGVYEIKSPNYLSAPYQCLPAPRTAIYVYTWLLPPPDVLAKLAAIDPRCFTNTDQTLGLLFSRPISQNDYVCRVPLYLTRGMARARIKLVSQLQLSAEELEIVTRTHQIFAELLSNIADLSHVGLLPADRRLRRAMNQRSARSVAIRNGFEELEFNPIASLVLGLVVLLRKDGTLNLDASRALIQWSEARSAWKFDSDTAVVDPPSPVDGVLPAYPVRLSQLPTSQWAGLMIRPCHFADNDPGMFATAGPSSITGLDSVKPELVEKLCRILNNKGSSSGSSRGDSAPSLSSISTLSYMDYFVIRYPPVYDMLDILNPLLPMPMCSRLTRHQNAAQVTAGKRKDQHLDDLDPAVLYLAETCFVHPLSAWLWFLLSILPVLLYQLSRATAVLELHRVLDRELAVNPIAASTPDLTVIFPDRLNAPPCMLSELNHCTLTDSEVNECTPMELLRLDQQTVASSSPSPVCPHPNSLLEATTLLAARDAVNLERLELLGDSLLRLVSTLAVFNRNTSADEGSMSARRGELVSNANLCSIAVRLGWQKYCTAQVFSPPEHFVFPLYTVSQPTEEDPRVTIKLTDKSLADMIEALIGCFVQKRGLPVALKFLAFIGISPNLDANGAWSQFCSTSANQRVIFALESAQTSSMFSMLKGTDSSSADPTKLCDDQVGELMDAFRVSLRGLQNILGYEFNDLSVLVQALNHPSSPFASLLGSYQRLEFLGDAVLDYVITDYLYNTHVDFDPGQLTTSRSNIVNNNSLACALVEHQLHPYIIHNHPALESAVTFVTFLLDRNCSYSEQLELLTQEVLKGLRVKLLADVFESIIGAIFVDSNGNLQIVSDLIHRLLDDRIHDYLEKNPIHPLKTLHFLYPDLVYEDLQFTEEIPGSRFKLSATVHGQPVCTYGATRNEARLALAELLNVPLNVLKV